MGQEMHVAHISAGRVLVRNPIFGMIDSLSDSMA